MRAGTWTSTTELAWRESFEVRETPAEYVFLRPRLYLETTIPSYLTARTSRDLRTARRQRITSRWWNSWRTNFDIYVSDYVRIEVAAGDPEAAQRRLELIEAYVVLDIDERIEALTRALLLDCGLPERATNAQPFAHPNSYWRSTSMDSAKLAPEDDDDPIVAEVRRIREEIAARFDYDIGRISEFARQESKRIREQMAKRRSGLQYGGREEVAPDTHTTSGGGLNPPLAMK
jgi:hypothetical protein